MMPNIENPKRFDLPPNAEEILKRMFAEYKRAIIEKEFGQGRGGGRVFLVHLVKAEAEEEMPQLPVVVKLAPASIIRREWHAFQNNIRDRLPQTAEIRGQPVIPPGHDWGGLCYPLVGSGVFDVVSLHHYCQTADLADLQFTLNRLLDILKRVTRHHQHHYLVPLQPFYDLLLPVNLMINPQSAPPGIRPKVITPEELPEKPLQPGDYVCLENFAITKIDLADRTVTLNLPPPSNGARASYCVRLISVDSIAADQSTLETLTGRVVKTRSSLLLEEIQGALGPEVKLARGYIAAGRW